MPTRKIKDSPIKEACHHPDHNVPSHQVFEPGTYEHTCEGCKRTITFVVNGISCQAMTPSDFRHARWIKW